jgi:hypothetical protein
MDSRTQAQKLREAKIKRALWQRGELDFLLDATQKDMIAAWEKSTGRKYVFLCSRRLGKTYTLCVLALRQALAGKVKILYVTSTYKAAKNIVQPLISQILVDCPEALRPQFKVQDGKYVFHNGSEILLYGADKDADGPRGQEAQFIIVDEAGFVNNLDYLLSSVLMPMLLTTNGRIVMATTPPKNMDHPFMKVWAECEAAGNLIKKTIHDCPRITDKVKAEYAAEAGGVQSPDWRREYLLEAIADVENLVIPEFSDQTEPELVGTVPRTPAADLYVGMDLGFVDDTALVFGWWDFQNARLVIEDELIVKKQNSSELAAAIRLKEAGLWDGKSPYRRVADHNNPQLIYDLNSLHGLTFSPANKEAGKEPMINKLRLAIQSRQILIHPRCKHLRMQLKFCRWKGTGRETFDRSASFGHFDLVDALILLWNSLNRSRIPTSSSYDVQTQYIRNIPKPTESPLQALTGRKPPSKIIRKWR